MYFTIAYIPQVGFHLGPKQILKPSTHENKRQKSQYECENKAKTDPENYQSFAF